MKRQIQKKMVLTRVVNGFGYVIDLSKKGLRGEARSWTGNPRLRKEQVIGDIQRLVEGLLLKRYQLMKVFVESLNLHQENVNLLKCSYSYLQNVRLFSKMLVLLFRICLFTLRAPHSTVPRATAPLPHCSTGWTVASHCGLAIGCTPCLSYNMHGNCWHIHHTKKEQIITMSAHLRLSVIAHVTGISPCTVRRILSLWGRTGDVVCTSIDAERPRFLNSLDIAVCLLFVTYDSMLTWGSTWRPVSREPLTSIFMSHKMSSKRPVELRYWQLPLNRCYVGKDGLKKRYI